MITQDIQKGNLLIAEPSILTDKSFNRAIILLTEHNQEGSIGFILNKPSRYVLKDLVFEIDNDFKVYIGGPVEQDNLYFVHTLPELIPDSIEVANGIYWGGNYEAVKTYLEQGLIKKNEIRFFLGYSGWSFEQLELELKEKTWLMTKNTYSNIFSINDSNGWKEKLMEMGGKYRIWANSPEDPTLN
jgi:putative transcriptional regulator